MSITTTIEVMCDACETYFLDDIEDEEDIEDAVHNSGGVTGVEIDSMYLDHLCEDCFIDLYYCEECDTHMWADDSYMCADFTTCADCQQTVHERAQEDGDIGVEDGVCVECDYEFPALPKNVVREPLVLL